MICDCEHGKHERDGKHRAAGCTAAPVGRFITGGRLQNLCQECADLDPDTKPAVKYKVHVFAVVRVPVEVESDSQQEAIKEARDRTDWYDLLLNIEGTDSEYAEELTGFLVDEIEDTEYTKSTWYEANGQKSLSEDPPDEHAYFTREDWRHDVAQGDTQLGYWKWVAHNLESATHCANCGGSGNVPAHTDDNQVGYATCEKCQGTGIDGTAVAETRGQDWASAGEDQNAGKHF